MIMNEILVKIHIFAAAMIGTIAFRVAGLVAQPTLLQIDNRR